MHDKAQDDERVMTLVELALSRPSGERERFLRSACGRNTELFGQAWDYVQWEERMDGFLLDPVLAPLRERPFEPGELLEGRFRILREVAQGGMGVVYEAVDEKLDRRIALKCAKAGFGSRLSPEARNATTISHPNVCKIFEIHTASTAQGKVDFLTMEFLDGETLAARLQRGPFPEPEARSLALQLCAGLAEAHRNSVIHGDLKTANVILCRAADQAPRAVITDFGLARRPDTTLRSLQSGQVRGTPAYMAPELWKGEKATVASDIYALGVILLELIGGKRVAEEGEPGALPRPWKRVVARCLDADPARRFQSAGEVAQALRPVSRRWLLAAAAATVLAIASGAVTYQRATAPAESFTLAVLPLETAPDAAALGSSVSQAAAAQIERLRGGTRARLKVITLEQARRKAVGTAAAARSVLGATHVFRGTLERHEGKVVLHAFVTDTGAHAATRQQDFQYAPGELRYAAQAMAGMVSAALRLPGPVAPAVNEAAKEDYTAGLAYTRRDSTMDRAVPRLQRAVEADPDSPLTWAGLAEAQWFKYTISRDRAWLDRASESVRQAQNRNPDAAAVHRVAGLLRANEGRYEQAVTEYLRAIELEPSNGDAYRRLGQAYERNNQLGPALAAFHRAAELEPNYFKVYQDLGAYYFHRADFREAILQSEKCVQLAPDEPDAHLILGTVYSSDGRYEEAERELRASIALGESPRALNNLATNFILQGKDAQAIPVLVRSLTRYPDRSLWWMNLGDAYRRTKLRAESADAYRRSLALVEEEMGLNPRDGWARSRQAYLCARLGQRRRAESEIAQALQLSPESSDTRETAVRTYETLQRREEALAVLSASTDEVLALVARATDLADFRRDSRYVLLVGSRQLKKELGQ